ncbi:unnamed protein product [Cladocopium goreaui]|uniref:Uncharacterized protein n=1 Tax=Cladocopium goreaui TaxID=2562237 RepID=A0A9P1DKY4_9DINO|nr:unnamed protein product [Cladocopium goreaui]
MLANAGISGEAYEAAIQACVKTSTGSAAVCQMRSAAYLFPDHTEGPIVPIKTVDEVHGHIIALAAGMVQAKLILQGLQRLGQEAWLFPWLWCAKTMDPGFNAWGNGFGRLSELTVEQHFSMLRAQSNNAQLTARAYFKAAARVALKVGKGLKKPHTDSALGVSGLVSPRLEEECLEFCDGPKLKNRGFNPSRKLKAETCRASGGFYPDASDAQLRETLRRNHGSPCSPAALRRELKGLVEEKRASLLFRSLEIIQHDQIFQLDPPDYNLGMSCCAAAKMWQAALSFLAFLALTRYEGTIIATGWWFGT